jgi:hypothetical protein
MNIITYFRILKFHVSKHWKEYGAVTLVILFASLMTACFLMFSHIRSLKHEINTAKIVLLAKESRIQEFDQALGISNSNLKKQTEINEKYNKEIQQFKKELEEKSKQLSMKDFQLKSYERTIATLQNNVTDGKVVISVDGEEKPITEHTTPTLKNVISYTWQDLNNRFKLIDKNIESLGDEVFTYRQHFKITGMILSDPSGAIQINKVSIREVIPESNGDKTVYKDVEGGHATLVESDFEYVLLDDKPKSFDWLAPITLRPVVGMNFPYFTPFLGIELVNLGRWVPYGNIGIVPSVAIDVSGLPTGNWQTLQNSRIGIGAVYQLVPPLVNTNIGIGATLSTPMNNLSSPMLSIDLVVYLSDDLFPL